MISYRRLRFFCISVAFCYRRGLEGGSGGRVKEAMSLDGRAGYRPSRMFVGFSWRPDEGGRK